MLSLRFSLSSARERWRGSTVTYRLGGEAGFLVCLDGAVGLGGMGPGQLWEQGENWIVESLRGLVQLSLGLDLLLGHQSSHGEFPFQRKGCLFDRKCSRMSYLMFCNEKIVA